MLQSGHRIGNYEIQSVLGDGGMAIVYRARHLAMGTDHAIKVLLANYALQPRTVERFRLEARAQFKLRHPNIVQVTEYVDDAGAPALVMDLVEGMTLRQAIDRRPGPWPMADVLAVMSSVLEGMAFVHREGLDGEPVVHRDLKPENILLDLAGGKPWPGVAKIADFGVAKVRGSSPVATQANVRIGTAAYMAPEQFKGAQDVDARADVWSLGMMTWELVAGRLPIDCNDQLALMQLYSGQQPLQRLNVVVPDCPNVLASAVAQALAVDAELRFQDAVPLLRIFKAMTRVVEHQPIPQRLAQTAPEVDPVQQLVSVVRARFADMFSGDGESAEAKAPPVNPRQLWADFLAWLETIRLRLNPSDSVLDSREARLARVRLLDDTALKRLAGDSEIIRLVGFGCQLVAVSCAALAWLTATTVSRQDRDFVMPLGAGSLLLALVSVGCFARPRWARTLAIATAVLSLSLAGWQLVNGWKLFHGVVMFWAIYAVIPIWRSRQLFGEVNHLHADLADEACRREAASTK
ncbi:MAG: serine/threonine protein kinase [Myxococcales bacterium]|nr:serine/threonine protein kinase [Myxococcales bacterium]